MTNMDISFDEPSKVYESPLQDFWATGAGWYPVTKMSGKGNQYTQIFMRFGGPGWELVASTDPYPFETAEVRMFYNAPKESYKRQANRGITEWEAFSESIRDIYYNTDVRGMEILNDLFGGQVEPIEGSIPSKAGRRMHMQKVPTLMNVAPDDSNPKYHDAVVGTWKVVEVEGIGKAGASVQPAEGLVNGNAAPTSTLESSIPSSNNNAMEVMQYALSLADGKSEVDFYKVAMDDIKVLNEPGLVEQLNKRTWVGSMISLGMLKSADGVLVKA